MPGIDRECEGEAATHHLACKCREEYFARMLVALHDAIRRPLGVVPKSAEEFYREDMAREAEERRYHV